MSIVHLLEVDPLLLRLEDQH